MSEIRMDQDGFKWLIRSDSPKISLSPLIYSDEIGWFRNHEKETLSYFKAIGDPGKVFVDVGAHVGYYSVRLSKFYGQIIALEPDPFNFAGLWTNLALNNIKNVTTLNLAAGSKKGDGLLFSEGGGSRLILGRPENKTYRVKIDLLDNLVSKADVIKIDTEGYELEVLKGSKRILKEGPIWVIENHEGFYGLKYWDEILNLMKNYNVKNLECMRYVFEVRA